MKKILYLHGLGSGGQTSTGKDLQIALKPYDYQVITVDLYHQVDKSMDIIDQVIKDYDINILVGTSLGGYFALVSKFDGIKIAVNPVLDPEKDLASFIGTHQYFIQRANDGETEYTMTTEDIDTYNKYDFYITKDTYIFGSTHDELLGNNISKMVKLMLPIINNRSDIYKHVISVDTIGHRITSTFVKHELVPFIYKLGDNEMEQPLIESYANLLQIDDDSIQFNKTTHETSNRIALSTAGSIMLENLISPYVNKEKRWKDIYDKIMQIYNGSEGQYVIKSDAELRFLINRLVMVPMRFDANLNWMDVSNIKKFSYLFYNSEFNGDVSQWNVKSGETFRQMFSYSSFAGDISSWKIDSKADTEGMFSGNTNYLRKVKNCSI